MSTFLDQESVMLDVAHDVSMRLEHDLSASNGTVNSPINDNALGLDAAMDQCLRRDNEGGAVKIPLDVTVDLNQTFGGDAACDPQTFRNDGASMLE
jgi:hypothetical protein